MAKISSLPIVQNVTRDEWVELIQQVPSGGFQNFRIQLSELTGLDGQDGLDGKSAYQLAVAGGYRGTQTEWLTSLAGKSAYQLAQETGYTGTLAEWLASLAGQSAYAIAVEAGFVGTRDEWLTSLKGAAGLAGKSAYTLAVEEGFIGSLTDWLGSLRGLDGQDGLDGKNAYQLAQDAGYTGTLTEWLASQGGASAYEVALETGFVGSREEWLASLKGADGQDGTPGKSAYALAVDDGYTGTLTEWLESLQGLAGVDGQDGVDGKSAYTGAQEHGYVGTPEEFYQKLATVGESTGGVSVNGGVFITDILPITAGENVGDKVLDVDGVSLKSCTATGTAVRVKLMALTGHSRYRPLIDVNGQAVTVTAKADAPLFEGTVDVTLDGDTIVATHEDGATWSTTVLRDLPPVVTTASLASAYPGLQTELKDGDTMSLQFTSDVDVVAYEVANYGIFRARTDTFAATRSRTITGLVVANRGNTTTSHGFQLRVQKANGTWSDWYISTDHGELELTHVALLNNLRPSIAFGTITYPAGQEALKGSEQATVNHTVANFDSVQYSSTQLAVTSPLLYQAAKVVTRTGGAYNVNSNNFTVTATREANGSSTTQSTVVKIADVVPSISISLPYSRLRSGGNAGTTAQVYTVTLTSTQALAEPPTLNAPEGTWVDATFTGNAAKTAWTRRIRIHDDDAKGTFSWNSLTAKSLTGQVQADIANGGDYTLGGFVFRVLTVAAFPNREAAIGTQVVNTAKLRCSNLSKGASGSLNVSYQPTLDNTVDRYSINGPTGVSNPQGDLWYNADGLNASSNTGGTMQIELEEVV